MVKRERFTSYITNCVILFTASNSTAILYVAICYVIVRCVAVSLLGRYNTYHLLGMSFYFIVSGSVTVWVDDVDKNSGKKRRHVMGQLDEGSTFGELALMHNVKRAATIVCKDNGEFLRVDKEGIYGSCICVYT